MNNPRANLNLLAASVETAETGINVPQVTDQSLVVDVGDYFNLDVRRENNSDEANGREEPDVIYDNGATASASLTFNKLQPNQAAFILAYLLGNVSTVAAGAGFEHTITPIGGDLDNQRSNPSFTSAQRIGQTINKRRFASCFVDSATITFTADDWVKGSADIKATGMYDSTVAEVEVTDLDNVTSLTLPTAVQGSTDQERLDNVQIIRAMVGGGYVFADIVSVTAVNPAVVTIASLGGAGVSTVYKILYTATEPAWATFPARITETPLRVSEMCLTIGGAWDGSAFVGGTQLGATLKNCEYKPSNGGEVMFTPCAGGGYAGVYSRGGREQAISLTREMRNMLLQQYLGANEYFGLKILCEGAEYESGHKYTFELIFPRLGILAAPLSTDNKKVAEAGDLQVLEDGTYGSVIIRVKNLVAGYAA